LFHYSLTVRKTCWSYEIILLLLSLLYRPKVMSLIGGRNIKISVSYGKNFIANILTMMKNDLNSYSEPVPTSNDHKGQSSVKVTSYKIAQFIKCVFDLYGQNDKFCKKE
jgi:hypothetical protein